MASRRRRRKSIGKVVVDVERRVRRVEKRPGAKRLKTNVVTTEKLGFRAVTTKVIQEDAVTANEAAFGVTVVSATDPDIVKEGTTVVDPGTGAQKVYSESLVDYVDVTDPTAQAAATASLQPSANTIVNVSNQITAINTNGITVYSGGGGVVPTTGARVVMNSTGLAGFNSSSTGAGNGATFSISASTGDAIFSGTVNATAGNFTGYVTAGTARFGANVNNTDDGIYINANNHWYDTGDFKVGDGTESMTYTAGGGLVVTGDINATGGTFTGYVTAGTARFGAAVQTGKNGIYINSTNYWYDDGSFKAGIGTSTITYDGSGTLTIGAGSSIGGTTASTVVSGAADGATALQEGNGVAKNGSDQITTISTASGIIVGTRVDGTGARIEMNSTGFYAYDGASGTPTVQILNTGAASFKGTVSAGSLIVGTAVADIVSGAADGLTALQSGNGVAKDGNDYITSISTASGIVVGTAPTATGNTARVVINSGGFFAYDGTGETVGITSAGVARFKGSITGSTFTSTNYTGGTGLALAPTGTGNTILFNVSAAQVGSIAAVAGGINIVSGDSSLLLSYAGAAYLDSLYNRITLSEAPYLESSGGNTGGGLGSLRNTWASAGDPSGGSLGDVWLKWV